MTDWWAVGIAAAALVTSIGTGWYNRSSANSASRSAKAAEEARDEAARIAQVEVDRDHRDYTPKVAGKWVFEPRQHNRQIRGLIYTFTLDRDYTAKAFTLADNGNNRADLTPIPPSKPDGEWRIWVEDWTAERKETAWQQLVIQFWPPLAQDGRAQPWKCRCERPESPGGEAHWDVIVRVDPPSRPRVRTLG